MIRPDLGDSTAAIVMKTDTQSPALPENTNELRELLVRFVIGAAQPDARFARILSAMEQVIATAPERRDEGWKQDLANIRQMLEALQGQAAGAPGGSLSQLQALLQEGDAQVLDAVQRLRAEVSQLAQVVQQLERKVSQLERRPK